MASTNYTLKVNIRAQEKQAKKERERQTELLRNATRGEVEVARPRKRKALNFVEPGKYIKEADKLRKKLKLEEVKRRIAAQAAKTGITEAVKLASLTNKPLPVVVERKKDVANSSSSSNVVIKQQEQKEFVPDIEWWDKEILGEVSLNEAVTRLNQNVAPEKIFVGITNKIQHPPPRKAIIEPIVPDPDVVYLTKAEKKKLRRQDRREAELEKREKIKMGLLPKPEPKLKKTNILFALGQEAAIEPSKTEQMVKEQEATRQQAHLDHNEANKLTPEERKEKKIRKLTKDQATQGFVLSVYKIKNLSCPSHEFKVIQNAKQLYMTGIVVISKEFSIVIVEGGMKQQRKYKRLMLDRIKWDENPTKTADEPIQNSISDNQCSLLWEGQVEEKNFRVFKKKTVQSLQEAKDYLRKFKVEHYWDLAAKMSILETIPE